MGQLTGNYTGPLQEIAILWEILLFCKFSGKYRKSPVYVKFEAAFLLDIIWKCMGPLSDVKLFGNFHKAPPLFAVIVPYISRKGTHPLPATGKIFHIDGSGHGCWSVISYEYYFTLNTLLVEKFSENILMFSIESNKKICNSSKFFLILYN